jgi:SNF2 family DNA or RNA helicase
MKYVPHEYQRYSTEFIIKHAECGLFLDMGCGKSVITLTAVWELLYDYFEISKVLIIAPLRVAQDTWSREIEKWEHLNDLRISKVLGTEKERRIALNKKSDIFIFLNSTLFLPVKPVFYIAVLATVFSIFISIAFKL